ncbi:MAG: FecR domain-containing protein [Treponema sp.]|nr:FecR domain-containing protein [Treponema sp.]
MKKKNTVYRLNKTDYFIFIFFSLAALFMFYLFYRDLNSFTVRLNEEPVAKIYFKKNTAQRKFIDNEIWEVLTDSSDVYDGDRIRTAQNSEAYTEFLDTGIKIELHEKSMIQIFKSNNKRSINFIGGEIFVETASSEHELVINSGKTTVCVSKDSQVKLALPENNESMTGDEEKEERNVTVEVLSGQVEVVGQTLKNAVSAPVVISAGKLMELDSGKPLTAENIMPSRPTEPVKEGIEKTVSNESIGFNHSGWWRNPENGELDYNYAVNICSADVTEKYRMIPSGAVVRIEMSGISNKDVKELFIQLSTGEEEWIRAHPWFSVIPGKGEGVRKNVPFNVIKTFVLDRDVVNTSNSVINIGYMHNVLDEPLLMKDFVVKFKVISYNSKVQIQEIPKGYTKTLEYKNLVINKHVWGNEDEYNFPLYMDMTDVFGENYLFPAGTKIKFTVSGKSDTVINWMHPDFINAGVEEWDDVVFKNPNDRDYWAIRISDDYIPENTYFSYSKVYELYRPIDNSSYGRFELYFDKGNTPDPMIFEDLKLIFEVM